MKSNKKNILKYSQVVLLSILILLLTSASCFAAEEVTEGRKLYNTIMLFFNFGILVFIYIKFAKKPLMSFLKGEGDKISEQIKKIETEVNEARSRMEEEAEKLKYIDSNLEKVTENILIAGNREKDSIIEKAKTVADKMVEDAKKEADFKMEAAKKRFSEEMLEAAIKITADSIRQNITKEDDEKLIVTFSTELGSEKNITV